MKLEEASILIVDDEAALCNIFTRWLHKVGCRRVRTAANGREAVEAIRQEPIDVLITDMQMPVMDGVTLVRTLAEQNERIRTIIFVSGFADVDRREMYHLGVENFLAKPFRLEELAAAIRDAIADRADLWHAPMEPPPRQTVLLHIDRSAEAAACFGLGRGGFSARADQQVGLGKVAFECVLSGDCDSSDGATTPDLRGQGHVRWRSRVDRTIGIEFAYLESPGREWVVDCITRNDPRPFIPALMEEHKRASDSG